MACGLLFGTSWKGSCGCGLEVSAAILFVSLRQQQALPCHMENEYRPHAAATVAVCSIAQGGGCRAACSSSNSSSGLPCEKQKERWNVEYKRSITICPTAFGTANRRVGNWKNCAICTTKEDTVVDQQLHGLVYASCKCSNHSSLFYNI